MNIVKDIIARIEERAKQTKKPCKLFATEEKAEAIAAFKAQELADYFAKEGVKHVRPARYIVVMIPSLGKWTCAFDLSEVMGRETSTGGYLGVFAEQGFYTF